MISPRSEGETSGSDSGGPGVAGGSEGGTGGGAHHPRVAVARLGGRGVAGPGRERRGSLGRHPGDLPVGAGGGAGAGAGAGAGPGGHGSLPPDGRRSGPLQGVGDAAVPSNVPAFLPLAEGRSRGHSPSPPAGMDKGRPGGSLGRGTHDDAEFAAYPQARRPQTGTGTAPVDGRGAGAGVGGGPPGLALQSAALGRAADLLRQSGEAPDGSTRRGPGGKRGRARSKRKPSGSGAHGFLAASASAAKDGAGQGAGQAGGEDAGRLRNG